MRDRRDLFRSAGTAGLALGLAAAGQPLFAIPRKGAPLSAPYDDIGLMNTALSLEHEAIWAYGLAGKSGLLSAKAKDVGLLFQCRRPCAAATWWTAFLLPPPFKDRNLLRPGSSFLTGLQKAGHDARIPF